MIDGSITQVCHMTYGTSVFHTVEDACLAIFFTNSPLTRPHIPAWARRAQETAAYLHPPVLIANSRFLAHGKPPSPHIRPSSWRLHASSRGRRTGSPADAPRIAGIASACTAAAAVDTRVPPLPADDLLLLLFPSHTLHKNAVLFNYKGNPADGPRIAIIFGVASAYTSAVAVATRVPALAAADVQRMRLPPAPLPALTNSVTPGSRCPTDAPASCSTAGPDEEATCPRLRSQEEVPPSSRYALHPPSMLICDLLGLETWAMVCTDAVYEALILNLQWW